MWFRSRKVPNGYRAFPRDVLLPNVFAQLSSAPRLTDEHTGVSHNECAGKLFQAFEVMDRQKLVDIRQHRSNAGRSRFEFIVAQQWIEPDEPPARLRESLHLHRQAVADIAIQAIADEQHD